MYHNAKFWSEIKVGDHLVSFDGTLTTIYEGEDAISPETRIEASEEFVSTSQRTNGYVTRLSGDIIHSMYISIVYQKRMVIFFAE